MPPPFQRCQDKLAQIARLAPKMYESLCILADLVLVTLHLKRKTLDQDDAEP